MSSSNNIFGVLALLGVLLLIGVVVLQVLEMNFYAAPVSLWP